MGFKNQCYCTAWLNKGTNKVINKYEKYAEVQLSTSKKVDGQYKNDWSDKVRQSLRENQGHRTCRERQNQTA